MELLPAIIALVQTDENGPYRVARSEEVPTHYAPFLLMKKGPGGKHRINSYLFHPIAPVDLNYIRLCNERLQYALNNKPFYFADLEPFGKHDVDERVNFFIQRQIHPDIYSLSITIE